VRAFSIVRISIEVPSGWTIQSNIDRDGKDAFVTSEPDKVVFLIGPDLSEASADFGTNKFRLTTSGEWPFSDGEALKESRRIMDEYARITGVSLKSDSHLMLVPFPDNAEQGRWTAEARGNAVVMLMPRRGSRKALIRRLGILLSHELFHLWVPNSLRLQGDYDWFFEGFTLYQALLTDVRLGFISFADYLETIGRVYVSYLSSRDANEQSLIEASEQRWTRSPSLVYDKGMLVAFIYDLTIRSRTNCKESISDVYKDLFRSHSTGQGNANEIIIRLLSGRGSMDAFVRDYIEGRAELNFEAQFLRYGLQFRTNEARPRFGVLPTLVKEQKELLGCLGYKS
jgi:predicted metalloprotease with PDZ domain